MVQLIVGHKGSGKTKAMVEMANRAVKESKGNVVVVEKDVRLTYEISSQARLVYSDEYAISGYDAVYGFITGLLAGNYDMTPSSRCAAVISKRLPRWSTVWEPCRPPRRSPSSLPFPASRRICPTICGIC